MFEPKEVVLSYDVYQKMLKEIESLRKDLVEQLDINIDMQKEVTDSIKDGRNIVVIDHDVEIKGNRYYVMSLDNWDNTKKTLIRRYTVGDTVYETFEKN